MVRISLITAETNRSTDMCLESDDRFAATVSVTSISEEDFEVCVDFGCRETR
jgi:hypothetical protein